MTDWWRDRETWKPRLDVALSAALGTAINALALAAVLWLVAALVVGSAAILALIGEAIR